MATHEVVLGVGAIHHESPSDIRRETFGHRRRGLAEDEVRDYLDLLADQFLALDDERAARRAEIDDLRRENRALREELAKGPTDFCPQAAALLHEAQRVADQVVEDAVRHARNLIMAARSQRGPSVQHVPTPVKELQPPETLGVVVRAGWSSVASIYEQLSSLQGCSAD
jgi:DivIVA domain-containing protein